MTKPPSPNGQSIRESFFAHHPDVRHVLRLFDHLPGTLFYAKDTQHRYVDANQRNLRDVFGLERLDQLLGKTDLDFQPVALAEAYHAEDRRVFSSGQMVANQIWLVPHVAGAPRWYVSTKTPVVDSQQHVIGLAGVMYPIETPEEQASFFRELLPAVRHLDQHYAESVSMSELAAMSGLSSTQFNTRFRTLFRMTPSEYLLSRRIQDAQDRLIGSSQSIADVGLAVGFFDQSHFTKRFRKYTGMTPKAYRKRFRGDRS
ncbi:MULTISPECIES: AraC family transcriptional regulator [Crateriforma]|uniref:Exoenzyme S synthesis regulatory protein ExsA n=1 Tax=Crateriforma conspicua TaxID=2527996 RepID=A0A5C6FV08_9PLAN|nr:MULTISPECIES: AraC family transcriptional regulator [Crateriforma]TWU66789.1 Exoenzyme S synthesis regulatory protein ExsA [Crateriforma conspicua]